MTSRFHAGCLDKDCKCRNFKLGAIRCLDVTCCHLPLGCQCLDRSGNCCPGGLQFRCQQISLQCGKCLTCGTLGCESLFIPNMQYVHHATSHSSYESRHNTCILYIMPHSVNLVHYSQYKPFSVYLVCCVWRPFCTSVLMFHANCVQH